MSIGLVEHVHSAEFVDQTILLDARASRYLSIAGSLTAILDAAPANASGGAIHPLIETLMDRGYLRQGRSVARASIVRPIRDLNPLCRPGCRIPSLALVPILAAQQAMTRQLRTASIQQVVDKMHREKRQCRGVPAEPDDNSVARYVALFHRSGHIISAHDRCLMKAICLYRGLLRYCGDVQLALGVRPAPFSAHAWVQRGDCVLGDDVERVRLFSPIVVV